MYVYCVLVRERTNHSTLPNMSFDDSWMIWIVWFDAHKQVCKSVWLEKMCWSNQNLEKWNENIFYAFFCFFIKLYGNRTPNIITFVESILYLIYYCYSLMNHCLIHSNQLKIRNPNHRCMRCPIQIHHSSLVSLSVLINRLCLNSGSGVAHPVASVDACCGFRDYSLYYTQTHPEIRCSNMWLAGCVFGDETAHDCWSE